MKAKVEYHENIGKFIYTYKFIRKTTNKLAEHELIKINNIVRDYCDDGATVVENQELSRLYEENSNLIKEIERLKQFNQ